MEEPRSSFMRDTMIQGIAKEGTICSGCKEEIKPGTPININFGMPHHQNDCKIRRDPELEKKLAE